MIEHRRALAIAAAALAALLLVAAAAFAGTRTVKDAKNETAALRDNGRLDIVKATAGHSRRMLQHTVKMRKRVDAKRGRERPGILINTRGGRRTNPEYLVYGPRVFRVKKGGKVKPIGEAKLRARKKTWVYRFDPREIPNLGRYGWAAITEKGNARDIAPKNRYAKHRP